MQIVKLTTDLLRVDGGLFRAGSVFVVVREYRVNGFRQRDVLRYALGYEDGRVVLPCVDPETVTAIGEET